MDNTWLISNGPAVASFATFVAITLLLAGVYQISSSRLRERRRRLQQEPAPRAAIQNRHVPMSEGAFLTRWVKPAGKLIIPDKDWEKTRFISKLVRAGYRNPQALTVFLGLKLLAALGCPVLLSILLSAASKSHMLLQPLGLLLIFIAGFGGFFVPDYLLKVLTERRRNNLVESFPDGVDMLVVCVEAGLGLDAAIDRVARELRTSHPALATELALNTLEVRAGKSREDSLHSLAERIDVDQVRALVTLMIQAERFGTSVGTALRVFAEEMRAERIQKARETAAKLPSKLIFPVILFIFPALFLVILGPAFITISSSFISQ